MKFFSMILAIAFLFIGVNQETTKQDSFGKLTGIWKSLDRENGEPLAEATLKNVDGKLTGSVLLRGLVQDGKNLSLEFPMTDIAFDGKNLSFKLTFQDANEKSVTVWEFLLRSDDEARLAGLKDNDKPIEDGPVFVMKRVKTN